MAASESEKPFRLQRRRNSLPECHLVLTAKAVPLSSDNSNSHDHIHMLDDRSPKGSPRRKARRGTLPAGSTYDRSPVHGGHGSVLDSSGCGRESPTGSSKKRVTLARRATLSSLASRMGLGSGNGQSHGTGNRARAPSNGTPGSIRRQLGNQPTAASPALRHMPNMIVNRILHKKSPEPYGTSSALGSAGINGKQGNGDAGDSASETSQSGEHAVRTEGAVSNNDQTNPAEADQPRSPRTSSFHAGRDSMLKEIRSKEPKLKLKHQPRRSGGSSQLAAPQRRGRSNSFSSADNLSDKSGTSAEQLLMYTDGSMDPMASLNSQHVAGLQDETDYHERVQQQIKHYEEKLKQARHELHVFQAAYVDDLSRENSVEGHTSMSSGPGFGISLESRKRNQFEAYNRKYKADELKLQEKVTKYEDKLNRLMDRTTPSEHGMMQGVKDHVFSIRRTVKSGLAQAQGGLHVPSFGKIFGSNNNINDDIPADENALQRIPGSSDSATQLAVLHEVLEVKSRADALEEMMRQVGVRIGEAGDGQEKLDDVCARLQAGIEVLSTDKRDAERQLDAALERISHLEGELSELGASFDNRVEDMVLRLQNAQLQMAERCQEIDENVEKCEARVSELEHHGRQALPVGSDEMNTTSMVVLIINATIAVLYTILSYWMKIQQLLPSGVGMVMPYLILLLAGVFTAWLFR